MSDNVVPISEFLEEGGVDRVLYEKMLENNLE